MKIARFSLHWKKWLNIIYAVARWESRRNLFLGYEVVRGSLRQWKSRATRLWDLWPSTFDFRPLTFDLWRLSGYSVGIYLIPIKGYGFMLIFVSNSWCHTDCTCLEGSTKRSGLNRVHRRRRCARVADATQPASAWKAVPCKQAKTWPM